MKQLRADASSLSLWTVCPGATGMIQVNLLPFESQTVRESPFLSTRANFVPVSRFIDLTFFSRTWADLRGLHHLAHLPNGAIINFSLSASCHADLLHKACVFSFHVAPDVPLSPFLLRIYSNKQSKDKAACCAELGPLVSHH